MHKLNLKLKLTNVAFIDFTASFCPMAQLQVKNYQIISNFVVFPRFGKKKTLKAL